MKTSAIKVAIRYSEAFKVQVVRELEGGGINFNQISRKYGIRGGATVQGWVSQYGNGSIGKVIYVKKPEEIDEFKQLQRRVRTLEAALADAHIDLALEQQYTRIACARSGITDVAGFKKKAAGTLGTGR
jgi:transposase-like protein